MYFYCCTVLQQRRCRGGLIAIIANETGAKRCFRRAVQIVSTLGRMHGSCVIVTVLFASYVYIHTYLGGHAAKLEPLHVSLDQPGLKRKKRTEATRREREGEIKNSRMANRTEQNRPEQPMAERRRKCWIHDSKHKNTRARTHLPEDLWAVRAERYTNNLTHDEHQA